MKYLNIMTLLSVLLCICMVFASCDQKTEPETEPDSTETNPPEVVEIPDEALLSGVAGDRSSFFEHLIPAEDSFSTAVRPLNRVDSAERVGTVVKYTTKKVDAQNNVTETYEIFNTEDGKTVLTLTNTYVNGNYDSFDWDDLIVKEHQVDTDAADDRYVFEIENDKKYPSSVMDVTPVELMVDPWSGMYEVYIVVKQATVTPVDEETRKENPEGAVYVIETQYTYYDIGGTKITESDYPVVVNAGYNGMIYFGNVAVLFDDETGKISRMYNAETELQITQYDYETEKYGYFFGTSQRGRYFELYNKQTQELLYCYDLDVNYQYTEEFLLHNGDMLIQYYSVVEEGEPYNYDNGTEYGKYAHTLFDASTGVATEIELPYLIYGLYLGEDISEVLADDGIVLTANARNVAQVIPIENKMAKNPEVVIFDNDLSVLYTVDRVTPAHRFDGYINYFGYKILANGDYLVDVDNIDGHQAIVKADGTVRSYIDEDCIVGDDFVISADRRRIYDYDMNLVYDFDDEDRSYFDRRYVYEDEGEGMIGGTIVLRADGDDSMSVKYALTKTTDGYEIKSLFDGKKVDFYGVSDHYFQVIDEAGSYTLYNASFGHILTSENPINVYEADEQYILETQSDVLDQTVIYTVNQ